MTDFKADLRHFCRNPKCRSKLKAPVSNPREAFCCKGCRDRFYRLRCYVCEEKKTGRLDAQTCGRRKCKTAIRTMGTGSVEIGVRNPIKPGVKIDGWGYIETPKGLRWGRVQFEPSSPRKPWRQVAGSPLTLWQLLNNTVPDGPGCQWKDGAFERIEAKNLAALKAAGIKEA